MCVCFLLSVTISPVVYEKSGTPFYTVGIKERGPEKNLRKDAFKFKSSQSKLNKNCYLSTLLACS
jgi:hypothetical protein